MRIGPDIARIAALIGDSARARMLSALTSGRALTSTELALEAGVGAATASSHLSKLSEAGLVNLTQQGRHKYWSLGGEEVLRALEALSELSAVSSGDRPEVAGADQALKEQLLHARACYDHLGGEYGVRLFEALLRKGVLSGEGDDIALGPNGAAFIEDMGVEMPSGKRPLCRACLDWSEKRYHLGGQLGAMLLDRLIALGMCERDGGSRVIRFSPMGEKAFAAILK